MATIDVSVSTPSIEVVFPVGTTVDVAIETPVLEVEVKRPTIEIEIGGSVPGATGPQGSAKVATIAVSAGVTATYTMLAAALLIYVVAYGTGGGTITVEKQTSGGDIFTDEEYSADGNPVLSRPVYFLADEVLGITTTGAATIKIYYQ